MSTENEIKYYLLVQIIEEAKKLIAMGHNYIFVCNGEVKNESKT